MNICLNCGKPITASDTVEEFPFGTDGVGLVHSACADEYRLYRRGNLQDKWAALNDARASLPSPDVAGED